MGGGLSRAWLRNRRLDFSLLGFELLGLLMRFSACVGICEADGVA